MLIGATESLRTLGLTVKLTSVTFNKNVRRNQDPSVIK